jgi:hypothetical protein
MITCILTQVVEGLGILQHSAGSLSQCQELLSLRSRISARIWCPLKAVLNSSHVTTWSAVNTAWKWSHHVLASPRSCSAAKRVFASSGQAPVRSGNLDSTTLSHTSASSGSSALVNKGGCVLKNSWYVVAAGRRYCWPPPYC